MIETLTSLFFDAILKITETDFIFFTFLTHPKHLLKRLNAFFYLKSLVSNYLLKTTFLTIRQSKNRRFLF